MMQLQMQFVKKSKLDSDIVKYVEGKIKKELRV